MLSNGDHAGCSPSVLHTAVNNNVHISSSDTEQHVDVHAHTLWNNPTNRAVSQESRTYEQ